MNFKKLRKRIEDNEKLSAEEKESALQKLEAFEAFRKTRKKKNGIKWRYKEGIFR